MRGIASKSPIMSESNLTMGQQYQVFYQNHLLCPIPIFFEISSLVFSVSYWVSFLGIVCDVGKFRCVQFRWWSHFWELCEVLGKKCILDFCVLSDSHSYNANVRYFAILYFSDSHSIIYKCWVIWKNVTWRSC